MSDNPIGSKGAVALSRGLASNKTLQRLVIQSIGLTDDGAILLLQSLLDHPNLLVLDIGHSYATPDLGMRFNYLTDAIAPYLSSLARSIPRLQYLNLSYCALTNTGLNEVLAACAGSPTLLYFHAETIHPQARDYISIKAGQEHKRLSKLVSQRVKENVKAAYDGMSYEQWNNEERRWVVSDKTDVRKIDSVYRTRDMGLARRGLKRLVKDWDEVDETLKDILAAEG